MARPTRLCAAVLVAFACSERGGPLSPGPDAPPEIGETCGAGRVLDGSVVVRGAEDLEHFGSIECFEIRGDLIIRAPALESLEPLAGLHAVGGSLIFAGNASLVDLVGLQALELVGGDLVFAPDAEACLPEADRRIDQPEACNRSNGITTLVALDGLRTVGGDVEIDGNRALVEVGPLASLEQAASLTITDNAATAIDGFRALEKVGAVRIARNPALEWVDGFGAVRALEGDLVVEGNDALQTLRGFGSLASVAGAVRIGAHEELRNIEGLARLRTVDELYIAHNERLAGLGLRALESANSITVWSNPAVERLPFEALVRVEGSLHLRNNGALREISSLSSLTFIGGELRIDGQPALTTLDGLDNVQTVESLTLTNNGLDSIDALSGLAVSTLKALTVSGNAGVETLAALGDITAVEREVTVTSNPQLAAVGLRSTRSVGTNLHVGGESMLSALGFFALETVGRGLIVTGNPRLRDLTGLGALRRIEGQVRIVSNRAMTSLAGLDALEHAGGGFYDDFLIQDNASLTRIDGFDALATIDGCLDIDANPSLSALDGFAQLEEVQRLIITGNPVLPAAEIDALVGRVRVPSNVVIIQNNGP